MTQCKHQVIDYFNGHLQGEEKRNLKSTSSTAQLAKKSLKN